MCISSEHVYIAEALELRKTLQSRSSELVALTQNPVDIVWGSERPQRPKGKVFALDLKYAGSEPRSSDCIFEFDLILGESFSSKLDRIRQEMAKKNAAAMAVTLLDEVAWLFNLRGSDIDFNPGKQSALLQRLVELHVL